MGSNTSTMNTNTPAPTPARSQNTQGMASVSSPFKCCVHGGNIPFEETWELSDAGNFYCRSCRLAGRITDTQIPMANGSFKMPGSFFGQDVAGVLVCQNCNASRSQAYALGWIFCMSDKVSFCQRCLKEDFDGPRPRAQLLRRHRLEHINNGRPLSWVLFSHTQADNTATQLRERVLNPITYTNSQPSASTANIGSAGGGGVPWVLRGPNPPWSVLPNGSGTRNTLCDDYAAHQGVPVTGPVNSHWYNCARCQPKWRAAGSGYC